MIDFKMTPEQVREALIQYGAVALMGIIDRYKDAIVDFRLPRYGEDVPSMIAPYNRKKAELPPYTSSGFQRFILSPERKTLYVKIALDDIQGVPGGIDTPLPGSKVKVFGLDAEVCE